MLQEWFKRSRNWSRHCTLNCDLYCSRVRQKDSQTPLERSHAYLVTSNLQFTFFYRNEPCCPSKFTFTDLTKQVRQKMASCGTFLKLINLCTNGGCSWLTCIKVAVDILTTNIFINQNIGRGITLKIVISRTVQSWFRRNVAEVLENDQSA